jgi:hypothetical protein
VTTWIEQDLIDMVTAAGAAVARSGASDKMKKDIAMFITFLTCWVAIWFLSGIYPVETTIEPGFLSDRPITYHTCWFDSYRLDDAGDVATSVAGHVLLSLFAAIMFCATASVAWDFLRSVKSKLFS